MQLPCQDLSYLSIIPSESLTKTIIFFTVSFFSCNPECCCNLSQELLHVNHKHWSCRARGREANNWMPWSLFTTEELWWISLQGWGELNLYCPCTNRHDTQLCTIGSKSLRCLVKMSLFCFCFQFNTDFKKLHSHINIRWTIWVKNLHESQNISVFDMSPFSFNDIVHLNWPEPHKCKIWWPMLSEKSMTVRTLPRFSNGPNKWTGCRLSHLNEPLMSKLNPPVWIWVSSEQKLQWKGYAPRKSDLLYKGARLVSVICEIV